MISIFQDMDKKTYEIKIEGSVGLGWADWFGDRETRSEGRDTVLILRDADRSAFYGAMRVLGDMNRGILEARVLRGPKREGA